MAAAEEQTQLKAVRPRQQRRQAWWLKKRKHAHDDGNKEQTNQVKKKIKQDKRTEEKESSNKEDNEDTKNLRYILFTGNLSYDCTEDDLRDYFDFSGGLKDVRLLTKKDTGESKGCAFLEFESRSIQMKALKLHHSTLCGRKINVELTCGGGGKGEQRVTKLKAKRDKMKEKRKKANVKKKKRNQESAGSALSKN